MRKRRELKLTTRMESLRNVQEFSERIGDDYFLNDSYFGNILTCLTEAVTNAIVHGNKLNPDKTVFLLMEEKEEGLLFTVIDQGEGYAWQDRPTDITDPNTSTGLYLIKTLADEVTIQNKGRVISMLFRITGIDQNVADKRIQMLREFQRTNGKFAGQPLE